MKIITFFENEVNTEALKNVADKAQSIANVVMGSFLGLAFFALAAVLIWAWLTSAFSKQENKRAEAINWIKWIVLTILGIVVIWALTPAIVALATNGA